MMIFCVAYDKNAKNILGTIIMLVFENHFAFYSFRYLLLANHYYPMMIDAQDMPQKIKIAILTTS